MSLNLSSIISFKTFRNEGAEWKRFAKILFLLVGGTLLALLGMLEFVSRRTGQTIPYPQAVRLQAENHGVLWNKGDSYQAAFKLIQIGQRRPDILVMGQSRMKEFRSGMFAPYSFYNFAKISWTFGVYAQLWEQMPADYKPKAVIFSFDFFNLNARYLADYPNTMPRLSQPAWKEHLDALRDTYNLFYKNPGVILAGHHDAKGRPTIGLHASLFGDGIRWDGSECQPIAALKTAGRNPDLFHTVQWNFPPIYYGDKMSADELALFEKFVSLVRSKGTIPIAVQMPIYGPVMRGIEENPHYGVLADFRKRAASDYFEKMGVLFFDFSKFPPYSDDYRYFVDAFHPTQAVDAAVALKIASDPRVKAALPLLDREALERTLEQDKNADQHVEVYSDQ